MDPWGPKPWPLEGPADIQSFLDHPSLTEGQRRRLHAFQRIEAGVSERIERLCEGGTIDVPDVAVVVITDRAHDLFFGDDVPKTTSVIVGERLRIHAFVSDVLPPQEGGADPYADLLEPAPPRTVRVLIVDEDALTILAYGTFVTVRMNSTSKVGRA